MDPLPKMPTALNVAKLATVRDTVLAELVATGSTRWPAYVAVAPLAGTFVIAALVVAGWAAGLHPFWPTPDITVSEAAAIRDAGELYRLLVYEHRDPNRPWPVRSGMADDDLGTVLPLEMAVRARRGEIVRILLDHGATVGDAAARTRLICLAVAGRDSDVLAALLATGDRSDPGTTCPRSRSEQ
jgi:hypothetical protein